MTRQKKRYVVDWPAHKRAIVGAYRDGATLREIAEEYGVSHVTICKRLDEWGVPRRNGDRYRGILVKDMVGRRFGKLVVISRDGVRYPTRWLVRCDCGRVGSYVTQQLLRARSCGCGPRGPRPKKRSR